MYKIFHSNAELCSSSIFFCLPLLTWGNCYNWRYWTGFSCMKHHLCWHNEQEFSVRNDDFLPAHIWHNLVLDASHHVTVMGPRLKSEQQRTYLCRYTILSLGERRHCATQSYRHHFYRMYNFILFVCMSFMFVPYKKPAASEVLCHHLQQLIILSVPPKKKHMWYSQQFAPSFS